MKRYSQLFLIMAVLSGGHSVFAAMTGVGAIVAGSTDAPFLAAALSRFISDTRTFTSAGELEVTNPTTGSAKIPFGIAMDQGKMRMDINPSKFVDPSMKKELSSMGFDRVMLIYYPGHPLRVVFPSTKMYVEAPLTNTTAIQQETGNQAARIQKTFVADEVAAGVAAKRYRLATSSTNNQSAFVWEAPGMDHMPVKLSVNNANGGNFTFTFRNIQQRQLDPRVFGVPANFTKRENVTEVIKEVALANMKKNLESLSSQFPTQ